MEMRKKMGEGGGGTSEGRVIIFLSHLDLARGGGIH